MPSSLTECRPLRISPVFFDARRIRPTRVRHVVLWLTVAAYMVTYMDRVVISSAPCRHPARVRIQPGHGGLDTRFVPLGLCAVPDFPAAGWVTASGRGARYADRDAGGACSPRRRRLAGMPRRCWSTRFLFGAGEAGAFPIATRSLSRWMLPSERGYAQGITHAGSRLGAAFTPPIVVWMIALYGWRSPFLRLRRVGHRPGPPSGIWYYRDTPREHPAVNAAELELIHSRSASASQRIESPCRGRRFCVRARSG